MFQRRCPWCGKKILRHDRGRVTKKATPRPLLFARCSYCDNYYGQSPYTQRGLICTLGMILPCVFTFIFQNGLLFYLVPIFLIGYITLPLRKLAENERPLSEERTAYTITYRSNKIIVPNRIYFLTENFDDASAFGVISPIRIFSVDRKNKKAKFCFLYDHPDNQTVLDRGIVEICN